MDHTELHSNISRVKPNILRCKRGKSGAGDIHLIAVSKTKPVEDVREAFHAGISDFGENYVTEAVDKCIQCGDLDITWHFLGPLQSNKARQVAEHFDWIHSLDRLKIAQRLNAQRPAERAPLKVCIQVNMPVEASKSGVVSSDELLELATLFITSIDSIFGGSWPFLPVLRALSPTRAVWTNRRSAQMEGLPIEMTSYRWECRRIWKRRSPRDPRWSELAQISSAHGILRNDFRGNSA